MSSVMITLGLSDGMVIKSDRTDGILPLGLAVGIDGDLGKGIYAGETCGITLVSSHSANLPGNLLLSKSGWITAMATRLLRSVCGGGGPQDRRIK